MQRKTSTVPTRVYTYGCRAPVKGADRLHEQLFLASRYYNALIEIERGRRDEYRKARSSIGETLGTLEALRDAITQQIDAAREEIKRKRSEDRKRTGAPEATAKVQRLRAERRAAMDKIRAECLRLKQDPKLQEAVGAINAAANTRTKEARAASGLYWGTYLLVERAIEAARKSKADPRFHKFDRTGRIGVQFQQGITVLELFGDDTRLQIDPLPEDTWGTRSGRRRARPMVRIRVGSDGRQPIWAELQAVIHRPLPKDGRITWAWIKVSRTGPHLRYELQVSLESEEFRRDPPALGKMRMAAIDIGWRVLPTGEVRVGFLYDAFDKQREFRLPASIRQELGAADSIRSINDGHFNTARAVLGRWVKEHPELVPAWMPEELTTMHAWRARGRLARVARQLASELPEVVRLAWGLWWRRTEEDSRYKELYADYDEVAAWLRGSPLEALAVYLDIWRRKETHLWEMETAKRARAQRQRRDTFRNWASELAKSYSTVVLEEFNLQKFARSPAPEEEHESSTAVRRAGRDAAPNEFRLALESALGKQRLVRVPAHHTTTDHDCGHRNASVAFELDRAAEILVTCDGCGIEFDQDAQAARNLLRRELSGGQPEPGTARNAKK